MPSRYYRALGLTCSLSAFRTRLRHWSVMPRFSKWIFSFKKSLQLFDAACIIHIFLKGKIVSKNLFIFKAQFVVTVFW